MTTRYQLDRELRRAVLARKRAVSAKKMSTADRGDYIVGAVGIVGCIVCLALALLGVF